MPNVLAPNLANAVTGQYVLSIRAIFREAWHKVKGIKLSLWGAIGFAFLVVFGVVIITTVINSIANYFGLMLTAQISMVAGNVVVSIMSTLFAATILFMAISHVAGKPVYARLVFDFRAVFKKLVAVALISDVIQIGLSSMINLLLMQPHDESKALALIIIASSLLVFFGFFYILTGLRMALLLVIEKRVSIRIAISCAFRAITQHFFKNLWLAIVTGLFFVLSIGVTLGISLIWTVPMLCNLYAIWYRQIFGIEHVA